MMQNDRSAGVQDYTGSERLVYFRTHTTISLSEGEKDGISLK